MRMYFLEVVLFLPVVHFHRYKSYVTYTTEQCDMYSEFVLKVSYLLFTITFIIYIFKYN